MCTTTKLNKLSPDKLQHLWAEVNDELRRRAYTEVPDPFVIIKGNESAKRAICVAAVQKHSIVLMGAHGVAKSMLVAAAARVDVIAHEVLSCPCGYYGDVGKACKCTAKEIEKYWRSITPLLRSSAMFFEVPPTPFREMNSTRPGTSLEDVLHQVEPARARKLPEPVFDEMSNRMLKHFVTELSANDRVEHVKSIAQSIAALAGEDHIKTEHATEAMMYQPRVGLELNRGGV